MKIMKIETIKDIFDENRKIVNPYYVINEKIEEIVEKYDIIDEIMLADDDGIIVFSHRIFIVFDEEELAEYVELSEKIFDIENRPVSIFVLGEYSRVTIDECSIPSSATFSIKLCIKNNPLDGIFNIVEEKIDNDEYISLEEIEMIRLLPMMVNEGDRKKVRIKCFKILNKINHSQKV